MAVALREMTTRLTASVAADLTVAGYDDGELAIDEVRRGHGIAAEVLAIVDGEVREPGGSIGLTVFGHNVTARALYERAGFRAISTLMRKDL